MEGIFTNVWTNFHWIEKTYPQDAAHAAYSSSIDYNVEKFAFNVQDAAEN